MHRKIQLIIIFFTVCVLWTPLSAQVNSLPLLQIEDLIYQGGFIIPPATFGESHVNYTPGVIEYNGANHSIFVTGFELDGSIAEFAIPDLVNSTDVRLLNSATILQEFKNVLDLTEDNNPQSLDIITGMQLVDNRLFVNAIEFYDAPADNANTTMVIENAAEIATSEASGYFSLAGAAHAGGWISPIPEEWQSLFEGDYMAGNSSKHAINSRLAMGISAFAFNMAHIGDPKYVNIPTTPLLDFDLMHPLYKAYENYANANYNIVEINGSTDVGHTFEDAQATVGENDLWTEESQVGFGFIVPGTRTYFTIGSSGGHHSGIGYKPTQSNGVECGGPCAYDAEDYYNYYWLWDVKDFLEVKNGNMHPYDLRPYAYGVFEAPFQTDEYTSTPEFHPIEGGSYDAEKGLLYLTIYDGGSYASPYDRNPVIAVYDIDINVNINSEKINELVVLSPNPSNDFIQISTGFKILESVVFYNNVGKKIKESTSNEVDISELISGVYFVQILLKNGEISTHKLVVN